MRLSLLILMVISVVADPSNDADGYAVHDSSRLHLNPNDIILVSELITFLSILDELLPRANRSILYTGPHGVRPSLAWHETLAFFVVDLIKHITFLLKIEE